jgi:hypothetical protein
LTFLVAFYCIALLRMVYGNKYRGCIKRAESGVISCANPMGKGDNIVKRGEVVCGLCLALVALYLTSGLSYGFAQKALEKLLATKECTWCDLQNADLSGAQLSGARLSSSSLTGAKLSNANLSNADLLSARLTRANLSGADLSGAFLRSANLRDANLSGANLSRANLSGANLSYANLSGADLSDTDLSGALWTDGKKCKEGSTGECKSDTPPTGGPGAFPF